ncbi:MAG: glycosyltransferase [Xanthomonadales bacterium]|jgi:GT2 family glycosyltransferase|nr:glycosyltransferase [Xanthomonadales bacterium]
MNMTPADHENKPTSTGVPLLGKQADGDTPILLTRRGLDVPETLAERLAGLLKQLEAESAGPIVLTVLSNAEQDLNPFAPLAFEKEDEPAGELAAGLVSLLGSGNVYEWHRWPDHAAYLSAGAREVLARPGTTNGNALARLQAAGGRIMLCDSLFLHDPGRGLFGQEGLEPHEERRPAAWSLLSERLDDWLRHGDLETAAEDIAAYAAADRPVSLHITHSWGGGVARWIESFIDASDNSVNLQLRAEGPQSGKGCGQRYALYLCNRLETPLASWWLQPPILSTGDSHPAYREILAEIRERHGVGRVIVSSLVGHSLDALATGVPTLQVLHDFYPAWPLLGIHPGPYLRDGVTADLTTALSEHELLPELSDHDAAAWAGLARQWRETVAAHAVHLAAPSRSVAGMLRRLDPAWSDASIELIPHGLPDLPGTADVIPRAREDGKLRLVIPGRIPHGKGQKLLLEALPELTRYAHVYLLGADRYGKAFFGQAGVDVILQFKREKLRSLLARIGPHAAGLLSVVPETFSYTLSEMQQLGIPVIATRVGSLEERIENGVTGWLIEPDAASLVAKVRELYENQAQISAVRTRLQKLEQAGPGQMVQRYDGICPPRPAGRKLDRPFGTLAAQAAGQAANRLELAEQARQLRQQAEILQREVESRTRWAEEREQARKDEEKKRIRWVAELENQLDERHQQLLDTRQAYEQQLDNQRREQQEIVGNLEGMLGRLQAEHEQVLASASWRMTRPLRFLRRVLANLARAQAWNPLRWPLLAAQASRTIRTRGLRGALLRAQLDQANLAVPDTIDSAQVAEIGDPTAPPCMPAAENPQVSIVIPVYNKWVYTAACLRSLVETRCHSSFEVIVVDDGSSDDSYERLQGIAGLTAIRNEENLGFIGSCNRGAEAARGEYIVMLNNDTQVLDGWLDALLDTFTQFPDTGLAGARLVYPDGRLQEAGGIIFNDGSGWNYGKFDLADRPEYQYTREADYCSGACIVMQTERFRELGGFDSHYAPAYYEDTDLAFRVRALGLKVRIQARATIVHHEGITSGTDLNSGAKRFQAVNRDKFLERWKDQLPAFPAPIVDPEDRAEIRRARDHHLKGRVLVIDAYTPEPDQDSGSMRLVYLLKCFRDLGYGVTFMPDNQAFAGSYSVDLQQAGIEVVYNPWLGSLQKFFSDRGPGFDFVMVSRHYVASKYLGLVRKHCPNARFLFDTVDLHYLREERMAELEDSLPLQRTAAQTKRSELAVINASDATLVVSPVEKTVLEDAAPGARVHIISNVHEVVGSRKPWSERKDLFFVGGYQHPPNIDAAQWFVGSIWPLIHEQLPDVEFHLIGSKAPDSVRALDGNGVRFQGFVESMQPWLDNCRLSVAPLRYGAGIKGKVNISMSHGQPVVATPMAVEGMFARPGRDVMVAETAEDFAAAVVRIYQDEDLWNLVSLSGQENVNRYFSVETARLGLQELLTSLS